MQLTYIRKETKGGRDLRHGGGILVLGRMQDRGREGWGKRVSSGVRNHIGSATALSQMCVLLLVTQDLDFFT